MRDYKRCLSIFSRLGRLNAKACAVFGDFIEGIGQVKMPSFRIALGIEGESGMEATATISQAFR